MSNTKTSNPKMPRPRRMIGSTLQWVKAKQAAMDAANAYVRPGETTYANGEARRGTGVVWHWKKARQQAAAAARAHPVPGALMYQRTPPALTSTAWKWERARSNALAGAERRPIGFGRA